MVWGWITYDSSSQPATRTMPTKYVSIKIGICLVLDVSERACKPLKESHSIEKRTYFTCAVYFNPVRMWIVNLICFFTPRSSILLCVRTCTQVLLISSFHLSLSHFIFALSRSLNKRNKTKIWSAQKQERRTTENGKIHKIAHVKNIGLLNNINSNDQGKKMILWKCEAFKQTQKRTGPDVSCCCRWPENKHAQFSVCTLRFLAFFCVVNMHILHIDRY